MFFSTSVVLSPSLQQVRVTQVILQAFHSPCECTITSEPYLY